MRLTIFTAKRKWQEDLLHIYWQLTVTNLQWTRCSQLAGNQGTWINLSYKGLKQSLKLVSDETSAEIVLAWRAGRLSAAFPEICCHLSGRSIKIHGLFRIWFLGGNNLQVFCFLAVTAWIILYAFVVFESLSISTM